MFALRAAEPWPSGELTPAYYRALHRHLFQDVYAWAGEFRTIRIGKGGNWFCYPEYIGVQLGSLFVWADEQGWFRGLKPDEFAPNVGWFLAELNAIHPFREGNGRTQFAFLSILSDVAGYAFNEDVLVPGIVIDAMIESFGGSNDKLVDLIADLIA